MDALVGRKVRVSAWLSCGAFAECEGKIERLMRRERSRKGLSLL